MYELARVRLHCVGPKGARYRDVTLDLREVGEAIAGRTRRPSPATVLFLENGGGKTVLMRLIFSVMLPGRRNVLGSTSSRGLEDYVLAGDVSHVILEWQHTRTGDRVVTAKASEWRSHTVSTDPSRLTDLWYTFRPTERFNVDNLPLAMDGRLVTLAGFRDQLTRAAQAEPGLQAASETNHREWLSKLDNLGLDPELFRYQRAMNAGEGEAADAFTFKTDQAFVDFLLRAVTDEEDTRGLADVVSGYASQLSRRGTMMAERDFVAGALERIAPLSALARDATAARELARGARREAERLAAKVSLRHQADTILLQEAHTQADETLKLENAADQEVRRLGAIVLELRRLVVQLRLQQAEKAKQTVEQQRTEARQHVNAWDATDVALAHQAALAGVESIRVVVDEQQEQARPALQARDKAAARLAQALRAASERAGQEAAEADARAKTLDAAAETDDHTAADAIARREQAHGRATNTQQQINEIHTALQAAVSQNLLDHAQNIEIASTSARHEADLLRQEYEQAWQDLADLAETSELRSTTYRQAHEHHLGQQAVADRLAERVEAAAALTESLAAEPRLADLLGSEHIDLDTDTEALLQRLAAAVSAAEEERATLQLEEARSNRVLQALGTGKLLPAGQTVEEALTLLENSGITAWAGWRYLAEMPAGERDKILLRYPHLIDGIILNNADHLDRAKSLLTDAQLLPVTIVAVGTTADMHRLDVPVPAGLAFIVPPNPALYDLDAAQRERDRLLEEQRLRAQRLTSLETHLNIDRTLGQRVKQWRTDHPPGTLARMRAESQAAQHNADTSKLEAEAALMALEEATAAEKRLRQALPAMEKAASDAGRRADKLSALAKQAATIAALTELNRSAREAATLADREVTEARQHAKQRRSQAARERDTAGDKRRIRATAIEEISQIIGIEHFETFRGVSEEPLSELRERYRAAGEAYCKVEVGQDLLSELRSAQEKQSLAYAAWQDIPQQVRVEADRLLAGTDGADAAARAAAKRQARNHLDELEAAIVETAKDVGALRNEFQGFTPQDRSLEPYGRPRDIAHGTELIGLASAGWAKAREQLDSIVNRRKALETKIGQFRETVNGFGAVVDSLAGVTPGDFDPQTPAFGGTVAEARDRRNEAMASLAEADSLMADADKKVRLASDSLARYAADPDFEQVASPARKQIVTADRDDLPRYAADWEAALKPRLRTLDDDLAQLNEHRNGIITRLQGMVDTALGVLRSAQRLSKLPAGMADWSGQEFLRIRFAEADPAALRERIGQVVDDDVSASDNGKPDKGRSRDGMSLLLRAVQAAMPKGVVVEMLKPDAVLRTERVRVSSISDVFSGGQLLTAAIILYCTLAALRANDRGHTHRPHAGVLFLDNPIGRASAGYLLELQMAVAHTLGVQLIYTTGLFDTNALAVFPLVVRLRNDADLRAGLKYLSVDSEIRRRLDALDAADGTGQVTATRVFVRPRQATP